MTLARNTGKNTKGITDNTMNVIGGRGGAFTALFGFFAILVIGFFKIAFYILAVILAAATVVACLLIKVIKQLYRKHKRELPEPPAPIMSRVRNPRDWAPPE